MARILVVDDEEGIRSFLAEALEMDGHTVTEASGGAEALKELERRTFDLLVTDLRMPGVDGMTLVRKVRAEQPETEVIVLTAHGSVETAVEALKLGAFDYLQKPIGSPAELRILASRALERRALLTLKARAAREGEQEIPLTYGDAVMTPVVGALQRVARADATVLLLGESGTGKEVAARTIHACSARSAGPFVAINCAALSESLLESELFGHEKGAFTGAAAQRRGRIELAEGGTFFLDEVGELKLDLQAKLLRVLQERRFERVGGGRSIEADVRWVAATNRDLKAMIGQGSFREDLYHRLAVFPIRLPPLRERRADLLPIAKNLLGRIGRSLGRASLSLTPDAEERILASPWTGNIRELANALERATILADGATLRAEHLWLEAEPPAQAPSAAAQEPSSAQSARPLVDVERDMIERALAEVSGNRRKAAERLGIGLRTLYDKLKRYGLS
jgi:two-component system, NtrC family, response regulator AtoC